MFMLGNSFVRLDEDHCCYFQRYVNGCNYLLFYVDDMLIADYSTDIVNKLKENLSKKFEMKDLGEVK